MNNLYKYKNYNINFVNENMMGPNSIIILEELLQGLTIKRGSRILDLGCGRGLTSIFLAKEYDVQVYAVDLWTSPTDNYKRFQTLNLDNKIIPISAEATNLPFAEDFFDAIISVDSYHYFGNNDTYFDYLKKFLKKDGLIAIAFPGMKHEIHKNIPEEMKSLWPEEALPMWQSIDWWKPKFENHLNNFKINELKCFDLAWNSWLSCDNPYAIEDLQMIKTDNGRFMNLIGLSGNLK